MKKNKLIIYFYIIFSFAFMELVAQETGTIEIASFPDSASVTVNGIKTGYFTPFSMDLKPGEYTFILERKGCQDYQGKFTIVSGHDEKVDCSLLPGKGIVKISSNPNDATVYIDHVKVGNTPLFLDKLAQGIHQIEISKSMYSNLISTFSVDIQKSNDLVFDLQPNFGMLGVVANPDADILIDGIRVGYKRFSGRVSIGKHIIEVSKANYITQSKSVEVVRGDEINLSFDLDRVLGKISLSSEPSNAEIYLNDKKIGKTPIFIDSLEMGNYKIVIKKDDYDPWIGSVTINSGATIPVNANLTWGEKVTIISTPVETEGADVLINGEYKGKTPLETRLKKGEYKLELRKRAWDDYSTTIKIEGDKFFSEELVQTPFFMTINTLPKGATIVTQGNIVGKTPYKMQILAGDINFKLEKRGYETINETTFVEKKKSTLNYTLKPKSNRHKGEALIYSLIFPGAGQSYLNRKSGSIVWGFIGYGCIGGAYYLNSEAKKSYDDYLNSTNLIQRNDLKNEWKQKQDISYQLLYGAAGVWGLNFLVTLFTPGDNVRAKKVGFTSHRNGMLNINEYGVAINF